MGVKRLRPKSFDLECTTVWSFPKRGNWATHRSDYRGNWSPQVVRNLLLRYSNEGGTVLDPMVGGGTTLIECKLTGRKGIGIDINPNAIKITQERLNFDYLYAQPQNCFVGDARHLEAIGDDSVDLILTHPPYADIIKYSEGKIEDDISNIHLIDSFCNEIEKIASECYRILKPEKFCAILIGDTRRKKFYIPLAFKVMERFLNAGFALREDIIKVQHNCKATGFWVKKSKEYNFLLIMHEHLFVFYKTVPKSTVP
ncbi:MAG: methyltransferase domain-containing protein [Nitrospirae bacterium]|nr:methyltransferase domain-containing protein [Nitrospirota bacterium]